MGTQHVGRPRGREKQDQCPGNEKRKCPDSYKRVHVAFAARESGHNFQTDGELAPMQLTHGNKVILKIS
ncbi:protein of unknown function [Candidatus Filomicrobium marinum]|uniref:Uncharacterized protein n=1 Tax=Candidatus Filomicrobium marinum TaxID=1608628 RepID=A0A0D6JBW1_9HYPH|nr:protein of unknown function [Candidatus Filomicrobium marinum]